MADPLSLLRQYLIHGKEVVTFDNYICFGEYCWPKDVKTNYKIYSTSHGPNASFYTLECLLYFHQNTRLSHPTYVKQAASCEIPVVQRPDRKDLLAYLSDENHNSASIDRSAPIELPINISLLRKETVTEPPPVATKRPAGDDEAFAPSKLARLDEMAKVRKQFTDRLDGKDQDLTAEGATAPADDEDAENTTTIRDALSREEIAALKAKRLAKKRSTIIDAENEFDASQGLTGSTGAMPSLVQFDQSITREILAKERVFRNRATILQSTGYDFQTPLFQMLQRVGKDDSQKKAGIGNGMHKGLGGTTATAPTTASGQVQPQQYNRYDQERFHVPNELGFINTHGTYQGIPLKSFTDGSAPPRSNAASAPNSASKNADNVPKPTKRVSRTPIIIIPATNSSLITMHNTKSILQDLKYEESNTNRPKENEVLIQRRKPDNTTVPYRIIDNPLKLSKEEWDRVVAVFVQGPTWQFKGWPYNGNPVDIFSKIKAFHLKFDETKLDANVAKWSVEIIDLSRSKRYLDRANLLKFWSTLDQFIKKHKHNVRY